jgi:hypothetical protein
MLTAPGFAALLSVCLPLLACGKDDRAVTAPVIAPLSAGVAPPARSPPGAAIGPSRAAPEITIASDGSEVLAARVSDVAVLQRLPDGTFKRLCGAPDVETRAMLEGVMRARRPGAR